MSNKSLLKFGIAFGLLAAVLIFLGVNYVPRINASSSAEGNNVVAGNQTHLLHTHYINSQYQRAIAPQLSLVGSDWIERHPSNVVNGLQTPPMSNYIRPIGTERFFTPPPADYTP